MLWIFGGISALAAITLCVVSVLTSTSECVLFAGSSVVSAVFGFALATFAKE